MVHRHRQLIDRIGTGRVDIPLQRDFAVGDRFIILGERPQVGVKVQRIVWRGVDPVPDRVVVGGRIGQVRPRPAEVYVSAPGCVRVVGRFILKVEAPDQHPDRVQKVRGQRLFRQRPAMLPLETKVKHVSGMGREAAVMDLVFILGDCGRMFDILDRQHLVAGDSGKRCRQDKSNCYDTQRNFPVRNQNPTFRQRHYGAIDSDIRSVLSRAPPSLLGM